MMMSLSRKIGLLSLLLTSRAFASPHENITLVELDDSNQVDQVEVQVSEKEGPYEESLARTV